MNLGIKVTGVPLKGINVLGLVRQINEDSDVYSGEGGRPLQVGEIYQHIRPGHWALQGLARKVFKTDVLAHVSGRFDIYRPLVDEDGRVDGREVVAKGRFGSREYRGTGGTIETEDSLGLELIAHIHIGKSNAASVVAPGIINIKTVTDNDGNTAVLEYTYSTKDESLPVDERTVRVIPERWFVA